MGNRNRCPIIVILAVGFCAVAYPILFFMYLLSGMQMPFFMMLFVLFEAVILLILIMNRLINRTKRIMYDENKEKIRKAGHIIIILSAVCLLPWVWSISEEGEAERADKEINYGSGSGYSSYGTGNTTDRSDHSDSYQAERKCLYSGCDRILQPVSDENEKYAKYCYYHVCREMGCNAVRYGDTEYCKEHSSKAKEQDSNNSSKGSSGYSKKKEKDEYGVNDYSGPEDFYEDNYDDFWDYEDAEDYYNEYAD